MINSRRNPFQETDCLRSKKNSSDFLKYLAIMHKSFNPGAVTPVSHLKIVIRETRNPSRASSIIRLSWDNPEASLHSLSRDPENILLPLSYIHGNNTIPETDCQVLFAYLYLHLQN